MESDITQEQKTEVSDEELLKVVADFLEMGHVENIVEMFKQEPRYYQWTGKLLTDERFAVRLGVSVLFEYLVAERPEDVEQAVPSLVEVLTHEMEWVRGEAVSVLSIIDSEEALSHIRIMANDPSPQIRDMVEDILQGE